VGTRAIISKQSASRRTHIDFRKFFFIYRADVTWWWPDLFAAEGKGVAASVKISRRPLFDFIAK